MAGNDDGQGIGSQCLPHGPGGPWRAHQTRDFAVGTGFATRDLPHGPPDAALEGGSLREVQGFIEGHLLPLEVAPQLLLESGQPRVLADPRQPPAREEGSEGVLLRGLGQGQGQKPLRGGRDPHPAEGRSTCGYGHLAPLHGHLLRSPCPLIIPRAIFLSRQHRIFTCLFSHLGLYFMQIALEACQCSASGPVAQNTPIAADCSVRGCCAPLQSAFSQPTKFVGFCFWKRTFPLWIPKRASTRPRSGVRSDEGAGR